MSMLSPENPPAVGTGATDCVGSDQYPYTVIEVSPSGKTLKVQADDYRRTDNNGLSEAQTYTYTPNPNGEVLTLRFHVGSRRAYYDPSF